MTTQIMIHILEGGPTYRLMVRLGLQKAQAPALARGAVLLSLFAWLPLLALSALDGLVTGGAAIPFLSDFAAHSRLLFALPLLVVAEAVIGPRLGGAAVHMLDRGLIKEDERGRFEGAVAAALRLRDAARLEVAVLVLAYMGSFLALNLQFSLGVSTWSLQVLPSGFRITQAGLWNTFVGIPLFQFMLYRWFLRLFIWWGFLWAVSRLDLQLVPTHPDRAGGLGFLAGAHRPLGVIAFALGAVLSGRYCTEILFEGVPIEAIRNSVVGFVIAMLIVCLGPLVVFAPRLMAARRKGLLEYGALALRYTTAFDRKWIRGGVPEGEDLLGSGDIQSLADLGASFERVEQMRPLPFGLKDVTALVLAALAPMLPVLATTMPLEDVVKTVLRVLG